MDIGGFLSYWDKFLVRNDTSYEKHPICFPYRNRGLATFVFHKKRELDIMVVPQGVDGWGISN